MRPSVTSVEMIKRILLVGAGIGLLVVVALIGYRAVQNSSLVVWFGLASALLAPAGFALIGYGFKSSNDELLRKLSKIPELQDLIEKAQSQEEKIKVLEEERDHLEQVIRFEAQRQSLVERREVLEREALRVLEELDATDTNIKVLLDEESASSNREIIETLREKVRVAQSGDIVLAFGSKHFAVNTNKLMLAPGGEVLVVYFRILREVLKIVQKILRFNN